jgi:hypothetical protein
LYARANVIRVKIATPPSDWNEARNDGARRSSVHFEWTASGGPWLRDDQAAGRLTGDA